MDKFIVLDIETTGVNPTSAKITEIGALKIVNDKVVDVYSQLINPEAIISQEIENLTGLNNEILRDEPVFEAIAGDFIMFSENLPIMGHNVMFDYSFLKYHLNQSGYEYERKGIDTLQIAKTVLPHLKSRSLTNLIEHFHINREQAHRAYHDAKATYEVYKIMRDEYKREDNDKIFTPVQLIWKPKKESPITERQKKFLADLIRRYKVEIEYEIDSMSKSMASKEIDRILSTYGR